MQAFHQVLGFVLVVVYPIHEDSRELLKLAQLLSGDDLGDQFGVEAADGTALYLLEAGVDFGQEGLDGSVVVVVQ